jgi:hypothetical protein
LVVAVTAHVDDVPFADVRSAGGGELDGQPGAVVQESVADDDAFHLDGGLNQQPTSRTQAPLTTTPPHR